MGYNFEIGTHYVVKKDGDYPWPCNPLPNRTIKLFTDDVLTKSSNGTFMVHTGVCCFGIKLTKDQVKFVRKTVKLQME